MGALDAVNQQDLADQFTGVQTFPFGRPRNVIPAFTDTVANAKNHRTMTRLFEPVAEPLIA